VPSTGEQLAFSVRVNVDGVDNQYVVVAPDIAGAARHAVSRSERLGTEVTVREICFIGRALSQ
jgi:hypothetical protein